MIAMLFILLACQSSRRARRTQRSSSRIDITGGQRLIVPHRSTLSETACAGMPGRRWHCWKRHAMLLRANETTLPPYSGWLCSAAPALDRDFPAGRSVPQIIRMHHNCTEAHDLTKCLRRNKIGPRWVRKMLGEIDPKALADGRTLHRMCVPHRKERLAHAGLNSTRHSPFFTALRFMSVLPEAATGTPQHERQLELFEALERTARHPSIWQAQHPQSATCATAVVGTAVMLPGTISTPLRC